MRTNIKHTATAKERPFVTVNGVLLKVHYEVSGTPNPGDRLVGEREFLDDFKVEVTGAEVCGEFLDAGTLVNAGFVLSELSQAVLDSVGEQVLTDRLWEMKEEM